MDQSEQLQKYLEGEMGEAEQLAFESQIRANPELAERVQMHRMLEEALGSKKEMQVEADLRSIMEEAAEGNGIEENSDSDPKPNRSRKLWTYFSSAAAVILLLVVVRFFFFGSADPDALFVQHYAAYDGSSEVRSEHGVPPNLLDAAFTAYLDSNFTEAAKAFQAILDTFPDNPRARFYLGICQLENDMPDQATHSFRRVIQHGKNLYMSQSHWYLSLACLRESDLACAKSELEILAGKPGMYRERAAAILDDL